jgi:hypothetical protein
VTHRIYIYLITTIFIDIIILRLAAIGGNGSDRGKSSGECRVVSDAKRRSPTLSRQVRLLPISTHPSTLESFRAVRRGPKGLARPAAEQSPLLTYTDGALHDVLETKRVSENGGKFPKIYRIENNIVSEPSGGRS